MFSKSKEYKKSSISRLKIVLFLSVLVAIGIFLLVWFLGNQGTFKLNSQLNIPVHISEKESYENIPLEEGATTINAPLIYAQQLYPKTPYISDEGEPCEYGCGAMGTCTDGKCVLKEYNKTVFDIPVA